MVVGWRGKTPLPLYGGHFKYITLKGVLQVDNKNFWFVSLCALLIISTYTGLNIFLRIAIAANAVVILAEVIGDIRRFINGRKEEKN